MQNSYLSKLDSLVHSAVDSQPSRASRPVVSLHAVTGECTRWAVPSLYTMFIQGTREQNVSQALQLTHDRDIFCYIWWLDLL